jgi:4-hydroxythreonine-4-phosphate dehydrogenase
MARVPTVSISMGDPGGIGPEVIVRALADKARRRSARFMIHGSSKIMHQAAEVCGVEPFWWQIDARSGLRSSVGAHPVVLLDTDPRAEEQGVLVRALREAHKVSGALSFHWLSEAIEDAKRGEDDPMKAHAIVTGPINKKAWSMAGRTEPGHTEVLARAFGARRHAMMFVGQRLRVVLATVHVALNDIRDVLTIGAIHNAIDLGHRACLDLGMARPRIAVCGLNPHAGEDGLMGDEEGRLIRPAIELARRGGAVVDGPFPGDPMFNAAVGGKYDLVVAMYHDQGLIPVKLLERDEAVNITLGLGDVVRTSPDHGTAFDIAGTGVADPGSMAHAIDLAVRLSAARLADSGCEDPVSADDTRLN